MRRLSMANCKSVFSFQFSVFSVSPGWTILFVLLLAVEAQAARPRIRLVTPCGGQRGTEVDVAFRRMRGSPTRRK